VIRRGAAKLGQVRVCFVAEEKLMIDMPRSVEWRDNTLVLLDQRKLPQTEEVVLCDAIEQVFDSIRTLTVRGAPAIGIAAAYGLLVGSHDKNAADIRADFNERCDYLISARPTAVNLAWAVNRMRDCEQRCHNESSLFADLLQEAQSIHEEDRVACNAIADVGLPLVEAYPNLLTHCNAGSLAVSELGTALAPIYRAHQKGVKVHVFVDETRPLLQGARLTAYELHRNDVDCTLISDNMAAHIMSEGKVDMVIVGADRVAANGDAANKIGTMNLAILCQYFSIPFYVAVPLSTVDIETISGDDIEIEERDASEVKEYAGHPIAPVGVAARSPAFDVTPHKLITGIITDAGLLKPPYTESIAKVMKG
jgi:methylthioribose-1-phosphate isomerase